MDDEIFILSFFRANPKNDQKNHLNVQFSQSFQWMFTNWLDTKEIYNLFFICCNQILDSQLRFRYIWMKSWKNWRFFEKTGAKKVELFIFNSKFRNGFLSYDKSNNGKSKPQPYTLSHSKVVCILSKQFTIFFIFQTETTYGVSL